jgi:exopolyphosphatase/guanosine-5'-triphosphate,3'-diphosphate pyrophosphatase
VRVASLDIGTNSVLLLIAERDQQQGTLRALLERATITRLGEGVDRTRELLPAACERTLECLRDYAAELARFGVDRVAAVGTSAMRDARGGAELSARAESVLGVRPEIISGPREAELTFAGSLAGLDIERERDISVFDVGGGSTEIVSGRLDARGLPEIGGAVSLDIGSVRLFERHVTHDPPPASELDAVRRTVDEALRQAPKASREYLIGVAGTVTTLASVALELDSYDSAIVHGHVLTRETVARVVQKLTTTPLETRKTLRGMEPRRADVIVTGAVIVERVLAWSGVPEMIVSDRGVRWGLAAELFGK